MTEGCPVPGSLVERERSRIATQYREAPRLQGYMGAVLSEAEDAARAICAIPRFFDLPSSVGEQLTFIGRRMGFPRCHCVCNTRPVHGFACPDTPTLYPMAGFCEGGTWFGCEGVSDLCLDDDAVYRAHLYARRYQILGLYDLESLGMALRHVWGPEAWIPKAQDGIVVLAPGRMLTVDEIGRLSVTLRALPIAPGIGVAVHFGTARIAGFGEGWTGFCADVPSDPVHGFSCAEGDGPRPLSGFCGTDATWVQCAPAIRSEGHWLCPVPVDPYACS